jgi:DNA-binding NarL/FixJ family response regulator
VSKVLIVDHNTRRASSVAGRLEGVPGLAVHSAPEELATVHRLRQTSPEVLLLGTECGDSWTLSLLSAAVPKTPILAYADQWSIQWESRAVALGARRLLSAASTRNELLTALVDAMRSRSIPSKVDSLHPPVVTAT